jgi:BolA protein
VSVKNTLEQKIRAEFAPTRLDIVDESHLHAGHAGARPEGETHFRMTVVANVFEGKTRVARQQLVYGALKDELAGPVHALSLRTLTQAEDI